MKRSAVLLCLLCATFALAQDASERPSREDVLHFLEVTQMQRQVENVQRSMYGQMDAQLDSLLDRMVANSDHQVTPEQRAMLKQTMQETFQEARDSYPVAEMLQDMIPVYQKYLTKSDLNAIVEFYSSPAGKNLLAKTPMMTREAMAVIMPKVQQNMAAVHARMRARIQEIATEAQTSHVQDKPIPSSLSTPVQ